MTTYEAAAQIIKKHPWLKQYERDLESIILDEALHWEQEGVKPWTKAVDKTHELVQRWVEYADEYRVDLSDFDDVLEFLAGRRRAAVWTILVTKHHLRFWGG